MSVLEIRNLKKSYNGQLILENVDLSVPEGSVFFLLGLNGAGKTTLLKCILDLISYEEGEITYNGDKIGFLIESPSFYESLTAWQNLKHYSMLVGCNNDDIKKALTCVRLDAGNRKAVKNYSMGMLQRLGIARALLGNHPLILLDEPFNGLDPAGIYEMKDLIKRISKDEGRSVILSSHLIRETENLATHYAVLHNGYINSRFTAAEVDSVKNSLSTTNVQPFFHADFSTFFEPWKKRICYLLNDRRFVAYNSNASDNALVNFEIALSRAGFTTEAPLVHSLGTLDEYFLALTGGASKDVLYR